MSDLHRFSSRRRRLDHAFLAQKLTGARSYRRIAGYFRSSIFELVGEEIASIPKVQVVCNSEPYAADLLISMHMRDTALKEHLSHANHALYRELEPVVGSYCPGLAAEPFHVHRYGACKHTH